MTLTKNSAVLAMNIFGLLILFQSTNSVSPTDYSALLNQLVQKGMASKRPIIFIIDNDAQKLVNWNDVKNVLPDYRNVPSSTPSTNLFPRSKIRSKHKAANNKNRKGTQPLDKKYQALLPLLKQAHVQKKKRGYRPPIIRSLLRISNSLRCQARNECEDECDDDNDEDECRNSCEKKFECEKEPEKDLCKDDDCEEENDCETDKCQGSTKGYTYSEPGERCPEC